MAFCWGASCPFLNRGTDHTSPCWLNQCISNRCSKGATPLGWQRLPSASPTLQRSFCHRNDQAASGLTAAESGLVCKTSSKRWQQGWPRAPGASGFRNSVPRAGPQVLLHPADSQAAPAAEGTGEARVTSSSVEGREGLAARRPDGSRRESRSSTWEEGAGLEVCAERSNMWVTDSVVVRFAKTLATSTNQELGRGVAEPTLRSAVMRTMSRAEGASVTADAARPG